MKNLLEHDMTEERRKEIYDLGWKAYFDHKSIEDCPDYPTQEERDEWYSAWASAQSWEFQDPYEHL